MALSDLLSDLRGDAQFMASVAAWRTQPALSAVYGEIPAALHPALKSALQQRGISQLYRHQSETVQSALDGRNVAVVTPTASGKTLCYNLPALHALLSDPQARALYLFPTKALAQDQLSELGQWRSALHAAAVEPPLRLATYDGDTPSSQRVEIRKQANLILTNPDMLHTGILPYHTNWAAFFAGLRFVVIDEMHTYRGVFGSHVANVLRRLRRICALYGEAPRFICTSATIANPGQLAESLIEEPVQVVDDNGAPQGEKHIILYNPPVFDQERGLRRSSTLEAQELAARCVLSGVQTIVFGRSRLTTEVLLTYLRERLARSPTAPDDLRTTIRGYRGGYLPSERRAIEAGLRNGDVRAVVATNALELGIDIGQLQAAVLCGYPGSIASTWQQMGRSGRTDATALAILVATGGALDQYVLQNPDFLFERSPEHALINPDNLMLLVDQLRCAAFEAPFAAGDSFGASRFTQDVLALLAEQGDLHHAGGRYFWAGEGYPSRQISLRSAGRDPVVIQAYVGDDVAVIGEIDEASAPSLLHEGAIYLHEGQSFVVERLNLEERLAAVVGTAVDYFTNATAETAIEVIHEQEQKASAGATASHGELLVRSQVVGFRRIKRVTHETLGIFPLDYPPQELETTGYWLAVSPTAQAQLAQAGQWHDSVNDYGPNWQTQRERVRARDGYCCSQCRAPEAADRQHDVHHLVPFRTFGYVAGVNELYLLANRLDNLTLVCRNCHRRLEAVVRVRSGLDGLAYALNNLASLHLMCDPRDIGVTVVRGDPRLDAELATGGQLPTVYIHERIAAGLGFSAQIYDLHDTLLAAASALIAACGCVRGCPACVGPVLENEVARLETKQLTLALLHTLRTGQAPPSTGVHRDVDFRL